MTVVPPKFDQDTLSYDVNYNSRKVTIVRDETGGGGGGGTEYTEGDTDASITGVAFLWEDSGDTLATVSASNPLPTIIIDGNGTEVNIAAFPAADGAALSNNVTVASFGMLFNGTSWDRLRGDTSGIHVSDISAGTQTNDVKVTLDGEEIAGVVGNEGFVKSSLGSSPYSVDNSAVQVLDASADSNMVGVSFTNAGDLSIFLYWTSSVSSTLFFKKLVSGETYYLPLKYTSGTDNDVYAIRASSTGNDDVIVTTYKRP